MKTTKRTLSFFLAALLVFMTLPAAVFAAKPADAVVSSPYRVYDVSTAAQLKERLETVDEDHITVIYLTNNIYETIGTPGDHSDNNYIRYWATVGKGKKILVLDGYNIILTNDYSVIWDHYGEDEWTIRERNKLTLFNIPAGAELNVIGMDQNRNYSTVKYLGALLWKCDAVDQRDLFEVNGGSLTVNGGYYRIDSQTNGITNGAGYKNYYQLHGTSVTVNSGSVTINSGSFEGRGFVGHLEGNYTYAFCNGAIEVCGDPRNVNVVINSGHFAGSSKGLPANIGNKEMFASGAVKIRSGVFEMDRSRAKISTTYASVPYFSEDVSGLGLNLDTFDENTNYYFYDAGANPEYYDARKYTDLYTKNGFRFFAVNPKKGWNEFTTLSNEPTSLIDHFSGTTWALSETNRLLGKWDAQSSKKVYVDGDTLCFPVMRYRDDIATNEGYGFTPNSLTAKIALTDAEGKTILEPTAINVYLDRGNLQFYFDLNDLPAAAVEKLKKGQIYNVKMQYVETYKGEYTYNIDHEGRFRIEIGSELTAVYATVAAPKPEETPKTVIGGDGRYLITAAWKNTDGSEVKGTFGYARQYICEVKFTAGKGVSFAPGETACIVNGVERRVISSTETQAVCRLLFDTTETVAPLTKVSAKIAEPTVRDLPAQTAQTDGNATYTAELVEWRLLDNDRVLPADGRFAVGYTYRVYIDFQPAKGFEFACFTGGYTSFTINGRPANRASNGLYYADYTFPAEYDAASCTITAPKAGEHPSFDAKEGDDGDWYSTVVSKWLDSSGNELTADDIFQRNRTYRAVVLFAGAGGACLSEAANVTINGQKATRIDGEYYYVDLETTGTWTLSRVDTTVTAPEAGMRPTSNASCSYKTFDAEVIRWVERSTNHTLTGEDVFNAGEKYSCYVKFTPKTGYEFGEGTEVYINGVKATPSGDSGYLFYVILDATGEVETLDTVSAAIAEPAAGAHLDLFPVPGDYTKYTVEASGWHNDTDDTYMGTQDTYEAGKTYSVLLTFRGLPGCRVPGADTKIFVNGKELAGGFAKTGVNVAAKYVTFTVDPVPDENDVLLTVTPPAAGRTPSGDVTVPEGYVVIKTPKGEPAVSWYDVTNGSRQSFAVFEAGRRYEVVIDLQTDSADRVFVISENAFFINGKKADATFMYVSGKLRRAMVSRTFTCGNSVTVINGTADAASAPMGAQITVIADPAPAGKTFDKWEVVKGGVSLADAGCEITTFIMGGEDVEIAAAYRDLPAAEHSVTVVNGAADTPSALKGVTVTVTASAAPAGKIFDKWEVIKGGVTLADATKASTTFVMGDGDVIVEAAYKDASGIKLGDVDFDGNITAGDARLCLRRAVELETYEPGSAEYTACDVDKDGTVTAADARSILRAAVELEDPSTWEKL